MRSVLITLSALLCLAQSVPVAAQNVPVSAQSVQMQSQLTSIEKKYFEHDFSRETNDYRLQRLEKFTFGEPRQGDSDARVKRLIAITNSNTIPVAPTTAPVKSAPAPASTASSSKSTNRQLIAAQPADTSYHPSHDAAPGQAYPHITILEQEILGQAYEGESLSDRLSRMEKKAFGTSKSNDPDSASRTDALEDYAESALHRKAYATNPSMEPERLSQSQSQSTPRRITMGGGSGFGMGGRGFNGFYPEAPLPEAADVPEAKPEDPDVFKETPPDAHARMLTRIGWCEEHLFGKTFPDMHLLQRLHQLNAKLFPNDKEPDLQLMDHVDAISKAVVLQQHPPLHPQPNRAP